VLAGTLTFFLRASLIMSLIDKSLGEIIAGSNDNKRRQNRNRRKYQPYNNKRKVQRQNFRFQTGFQRNRQQFLETELMVSHTTEAKGLAGKLSFIVRNGDPPQIFMVGTDCTNQAVKGIAIARNALKKNRLDVLVQPRFQRVDASQRNDRDAYAFALRKGPFRISKANATVMKVSSSTDPGVLAGAIAKKLGAGERVSLIMIGATTVNIAVKSVVFARKYLSEDSMDIGFRPQWSKFNMNGEETVGLKFFLYASQS